MLFTIANINEVGDKWKEYLNPTSLVVKNNSKIWNLHKNAKVGDKFQFERAGYFVIDDESDLANGKFIFNRIVELKESKEKGQ